jgi:TRAP transporter TAXI family solute receptor
MSEPVNLKILGSGSNWMNISGIVAVSLNSYYSPLPRGSLVSVTTMDPGVGSMESPNLLAEKQYDVGFTTPAWYARLAYDGMPPFDKPLPLRSLALFPHDDRMVFGVQRKTGIKSIADIRDKKYPLRFSIPVVEKLHPAIWAADAVFQEYGFSRADIISWGGQQLMDRPKSFTDPRVKPISDEWDAIFDEAIMTPRWTNLTEQYDIEFLSIPEDILQRLEKRGWRRGTIAKGRFRGVDSDVTTLDFSDWLMFCRADLDDDVVYYLTQHTVENCAAFNERIPVAMTAQMDPMVYLPKMPIPLHPGAERYYAEKGYL